MRRAIAAGALLGAAVLVALHLARGISYWDYSEGVYALTSRLFLHGADLYGHVVAAQPPWQFVFGAGVLWIDDSLRFLRFAVGLAQLATGVLGAVAVWRLTGSRAATLLTPALALLTPWAVRQHGVLEPELLAPVPMLAAALLATDERRVPLAAVLVATTPFLKLPFAFAVIAVVVCSAAPRRAALWAAIALIVQALAFTALFGTDLWKDTVIAQLHTGQHTLGELKGVWGQALWSLLGLLVLAALSLRAEVRDRALKRMFVGLAIAMLLTLATNTKQGTSLSVLVPIEATLVPLAVTGLLRARVAYLALAFTLAMTASLLIQPHTNVPFIYPGSQRGAWGRFADDAQVRAQVAAARRCRAPYGGAPFIAFLARRPMPDDQPDGFLPEHSITLKAVADRVAASHARCP